MLNRIPLRTFPVGSHLKFYAGSKLGFAGSQVQSRLGYDFPGGKLSEIWGRIPRGIGGILGLIPPGMCFLRWDAIRKKMYFEEKSFLQIEIRCVTMSTYGSTTFSNISDRGFSELWKELPIINSLLDDRGFSELVRELPIAYRLLGERGFRI